MVVVKFVQIFEEEGLALDMEIDDTETTTLFWSANHVPSRKGVTFISLLRFFCPKALSSEFIKQL